MIPSFYTHDAEISEQKNKQEANPK